MSLRNYFESVESSKCFAVYADAEGNIKDIFRDSSVELVFALAERIFHDEPFGSEVEYILKADNLEVSGTYRNKPFPESTDEMVALAKRVIPVGSVNNK